MCGSCRKTKLSKGKASKPTSSRTAPARSSTSSFGKTAVKISFGSKKR